LSLIFIQNVFAAEFGGQDHANRILILVPGTLNSIVPGAPEQYLNPSEEVEPYFSAAVINEFKKQFYAVRVTPHLDYFGDIKKNGRRVYADTLNWYTEITKNMPYKPEIWIFGHSAGGLYALYTSHLNNKYGNTLPIKKISMLSTPLKGVEFIDKITRLPYVFESVAEFFLNSVWPLDFRGLWGLRSENVSTFLSELTLSPTIEIDAFAGTQSSPQEACDIFNSHFLSPPLTALQKFMNRLGDGIVSKRSALTDPVIATTDGKELRIKSHPEYIVPLDHVEQVWDYRYLKALGTIAPEYVLNKQIESYQTMLSIISAQ
jgi:hypothetical protein